MTGGTVNKNESDGDGAGIYLAYTDNTEYALLKLSGSPDFGGSGTDVGGNISMNNGNWQSTVLVGKTNGGKYYEKARQDIFIAGYASENAEDTSAASLVINGDITSGAGTIWVWAEQSPHYKTLCQFAKYTANVTNTPTTLVAFRNAQDDATTGADQIGRYLYGVVKSDDTGSNVYWNGTSGSRKVILRKVRANDYTPLSGRSFTVCQGTGTAAYTVKHQDGTTETLTNLTSQSSGVFWIGELPYGTYTIREGNVAVFTLTVGDDTVPGSRDGVVITPVS